MLSLHYPGLRFSQSLVTNTNRWQYTNIVWTTPEGRRLRVNVSHEIQCVAMKAVKHDWHIMHDTTKNEVRADSSAVNLTRGNLRCQKVLVIVMPEDGSKHAWIAASWKQDGSIRTHPGTSPRIGLRKRHQGEDLCREHWAILNRLRSTEHQWRSRTWRTEQHVSVAS